MADTKAVIPTEQKKQTPVKKPVITYNDDDTYNIDDTDWQKSYVSGSDTRYRTKKDKKGNPVINKKTGAEEKEEYPYRYVYKKGDKEYYSYINSPNEAPMGATVYGRNLMGWNNDDRGILPTTSNGSEYDLRKKEAYDKWYGERDAEAQAEVAKRKADREAKAKVEAEKQAVKENPVANATKKAADVEQAKSFADMSFAEYNTDGVFDNDNSTAKELVAKAQAEGMTIDEFIDAIEGTKWANSKQLPTVLEQNVAGFKQPEQKEIEDAVKNNEPDKNGMTLEEIINMSEEDLQKLKDEGKVVNRITKEPTKEKKAEEKARKKYFKKLERKGKKAKRKEDFEKWAAGDEEQYKQFLNSANPNLIKLICGKSGATLGDRMAALGELLAMAVADTANGIYAGVNKTSFTPTKGRMSSIFSPEALKKSLDRTEERLDAENKSKVEQDEVVGYMNTTPALKDLPTDTKKQLAVLVTNGAIDEQSISDATNITDKQTLSDIANGLKSVSTLWQTGNERRALVLENTQKQQNITSTQLDNIAKAVNTEQGIDNFILDLKETQKGIYEAIVGLEDANQEKYFEFIYKFLGYLGGVENYSNQATSGKINGWNVNAGLSVGWNGLGGSIGGGYEDKTTKGTLTGEQIDTLKKLNIPVAEQGAADWSKEREKYVEPLRKALKQQYDYIGELIKDKEAQKKEIRKNLRATGAVNDGIIKAPHMKQWLLREDGTKIKLNPSDSIYATKNKITTEKDNGQPVVQMEPEDKAVTIMKKLGHCDGKNINKCSDYYLSRLK